MCDGRWQHDRSTLLPPLGTEPLGVETLPRGRRMQSQQAVRPGSRAACGLSSTPEGLSSIPRPPGGVFRSSRPKEMPANTLHFLKLCNFPMIIFVSPLVFPYGIGIKVLT